MASETVAKCDRCDAVIDNVISDEDRLAIKQMIARVPQMHFIELCGNCGGQIVNFMQEGVQIKASRLAEKLDEPWEEGDEDEVEDEDEEQDEVDYKPALRQWEESQQEDNSEAKEYDRFTTGPEIEEK